MKSVIVAAGKVVDTENLKISAEVATVYAKENDESGSSAQASKHIVSLRVKQFNARIDKEIAEKVNNDISDLLKHKSEIVKILVDSL